MNGLMIKTLAFAAILMIATVYVVMRLDIDIVGDSVNAITMGGALAIAGITAYVTTKYIGQMKSDTASGKLADESWDGINEYKNELPSGWAYSFLAVFIWSMWYGFFGYPINAYSQIGEYNEEVQAYNKKFEEAHKNPSNEELHEMGESIYLVQCAQCHGNTGDGLSGKAEDFTVRTKESILKIINEGQNALHAFAGGMPGGMASGKDAEDIALYVASGFQGEQPPMYAICGGCHGANGEGVEMVGPRINGFDIKNTLAHGKKGAIGTMPIFSTLITPIQEKALDTYIQSLLIKE